MLTVVFDMDGVLFDTQKVYTRTWLEVAKMLGIKNIETPLKLCIGRNKVDQVDIMTEHLGKDFPFDKFYALKDEVFDKHIEEDGVPLMKGTKEILETLKSLGARIAIASSSRVDVVMHHLKETGLTEYFDVVIGGNMVSHSKPFPDIYLKACEELGVKPEETFAVEDSYNGIISAHDAGLKTIMIPDALPPTEEYDRMLYRRFEDLRGLSEFFTIKELMEKVWQKYKYASILCENRKGKRFSVSKQGMKAMEDKLFCARGYVIKAHNGKNYAEYSFNELSVSKFNDIIFHLDELFAVNLPSNSYKEPAEEEISFFKENKVNKHPRIVGDKAILDRLSELREEGLKANEQILDCTVNAAYQEYEKIFISLKKEMSEKVCFMTSALSMMAKKDEVIKSYFRSYSNLDGCDVLSLLEEDIPDVASNVVALLDAGKITPGEYECICTPEVTGMIAHEAFGHGVEMDMFVKNRAKAVNFVGEYVASPLVTMHDGAKSAKEVATYDFDDEGTLGSDTVIIDKGILKTGISDLQTGLALNTFTTGNGRRENYERKAYTRMTNTFFEGGQDKVSDMIKSIKYGFMLENATCGMEDPKNWGIQCMVNVAREIKDGEFTGKIFSPIVLSGYVPTLLKSISAMSETPVLNGGGFCGKGYKEWVKVSDGGPYIKARIELG